MRALVAAVVGMYVSLVWGQSPQMAPPSDWVNARPASTVSLHPHRKLASISSAQR